MPRTTFFFSATEHVQLYIVMYGFVEEGFLHGILRHLSVLLPGSMCAVR